MLGVQEEDGSFSAHTLSNDHNAQNEGEVSRIRGEHPPSERKTVIRQVRRAAAWHSVTWSGYAASQGSQGSAGVSPSCERVKAG